MQMSNLSSTIPSSQGGSSTPRRKPRSKLHHLWSHIFNLIVALLLLTPLAAFGILIWALIAFAQVGSSSSQISDCTSRESGNGFTGNSDFYGFGIRLGIYFQWWATLIANLFLPTEWYSMFGAYMVLSLALIIAVIVLAFQHACTFTVEIIIVLFMYWAGFTALSVSTKATIDALFPVDMAFFPGSSGFGVGLSMALFAPTLLGTAFSVWFWLRLTTAGEVDFTPTPGGTTYFLFTKVSAQTKPAINFIVFLCFLFGWSVFCSALAALLGSAIGIIWLEAVVLYKRMTGQVISKRKWRPRRPKKSQPVENVTELTHTHIGLGIVCALILIYSTIAIELTLVWNSISGIYSVDSTGQIIPLIAGACLFINAMWKLGKESPWAKRKSRAIQPNSEAEDGTNNHELIDLENHRPLMAYQHDDATWR